FRRRGRTEALVGHELLDNSRSQDEGLLQQFAEALAAVARDDLGTARKLFGTLASRYPDDAPTRFYAALCDGRGTAGATVRAGVVLVETKEGRSPRFSRCRLGREPRRPRMRRAAPCRWRRCAPDIRSPRP